MSADRTLPQTAEELRLAQERSLQRARPPLQVPGYEIERFLGAGAYGEVWVAMDRNTGRRVAIKFYTHRGGLDWSLLSREVEKLAFLFTDRYVVQLIDVGWNADPPYYVMEFLEQGSLADRLQEGPLRVPEALELFRELAVGLVHSHGKGVLHCDLKPANVLLDHHGKPRLADFGQSRLSHEQTPALGTLFYMAPEQADLKAVPDARWDVYGLGALFYCMLTGDPPYRDAPGAADIQDVSGIEEQLSRYRELIRTSRRARRHRAAAGVDGELAAIVDRCLAPDPQKRFPNPQAVLGALEARAARLARRPLLVLGAVGPAVLLVVMALFFWKLLGTAVGTTNEEVIGRALQSNRFAAQAVAGTVAEKIASRWHVLEHEAADAELRQLLTAAIGRRRGTPQRNALQEWLESVDREYDKLETASWVVMDSEGTQLARSPESATVDQNYAHRDYFHGLGKNLPKGVQGIEPIHEPNLSAVYKSDTTENRKVSFSVPIFNAKRTDPDRRIIGVLTHSVELGRFAEWRPQESSLADQFSVLVDSKPDWTGRAGVILEHPHLAELLRRKTGSLPDLRLGPAYVEEIEKLRAAATQTSEQGRASSQTASLAQYHDPVGDKYQGRWLAAVQPVIVNDRPASVGDTGWAVIVQERYAAAVEPIQELGYRLVRVGLWALVAIIAVITALWGFVMIVLDVAPRFRLLARLRRKIGLGRAPDSGVSLGSSLESRRATAAGGDFSPRTADEGSLQ
ncbi:MAG: serine/threonine protein kinase [Pirellulales bacterium]